MKISLNIPPFKLVSTANDVSLMSRGWFLILFGEHGLYKYESVGHSDIDTIDNRKLIIDGIDIV